MLSTRAVTDYLVELEREVAGYRVPVVDLLAVQTADPYRILIATILSSRTKDEVTATASARLFAQAPDVYQLATLSTEHIEELVYPVGFYKTKAKHLHDTARILIDSFAGNVPKRLEQLISLPGVGRKTANLVLSVAFSIPAICVDTHVHRIMNIWGYVATRTPHETEMALQKRLPEQWWGKVNRILVAFGQQTCRPVSPWCSRCVLQDRCARLGVRSGKRIRGV